MAASGTRYALRGRFPNCRIVSSIIVSIILQGQLLRTSKGKLKMSLRLIRKSVIDRDGTLMRSMRTYLPKQFNPSVAHIEESLTLRAKRANMIGTAILSPFITNSPPNIFHF